MGSPDLRLSVPLDRLRCAKCAPNGGEFSDPAAYSRSYLESAEELNELKVEVDVEKIRRTLDREGRYSIDAVFRLRCPVCQEPRVSTTRLARWHIAAFASLAVCSKCGGQGKLLTQALEIQHVDETTDVVSGQATFRCVNGCSKLGMVVEVTLRALELARYLVRSSQERRQSHEVPPAIMTVGRDIRIYVGVNEVGDRIKVEGDNLGVVSSGKVRVGSIQTTKKTIDASSRIGADVKHVLRQACEMVEQLRLARGDAERVSGDLHAIVTEIESGSPAPGRIQQAWNSIREIAPTVATVVATAEAIRKLLGQG